MLTPTLRQPFYAIVTFKGDYCVARCNGQHWEFDSTSTYINEMLHNGLINLDIVQAWIDTKATTLPQG